jgi:hypothetical protein
MNSMSITLCMQTFALVIWSFNVRFLDSSSTVTWHNYCLTNLLRAVFVYLVRSPTGLFYWNVMCDEYVTRLNIWQPFHLLMVTGTQPYWVWHPSILTSQEQLGHMALTHISTLYGYLASLTIRGCFLYINLVSVSYPNMSMALGNRQWR